MTAILHREKSAFQEILVLESPALGKVLVLDGVVQCAQRDEAIYHEMLAHSDVFLRLAAVPPPVAGLNVLVVGGGDGGIARECLKHAGVAQVTVVDIDPRVRETVLAHYPELPASAYADPRLAAVDTDAAGFVRQHRDCFDLIIADTTDPVGMALPLFGREFVADCFAALKEGGAFVRHAGSLLLQADEFTQARGEVAAAFGPQRTRTGLFATCSYLGGWFSWVSALKNARYPEAESALQAMRALFEQSALDVRWYSPEMQCASLVLPRLVAEPAADKSP